MPALQRLQKREIDGLLKWYQKSQREFPWRKNPNPYWVWLAEIMSQQTTMTALMPFFYRFIEKFPNIEALARASEDEVLSAWTGLGYYSRARNIQKAAKEIVALGNFPRTLKGWLELPGVGPYTAAAVVSQCFGIAEPVWDGNVLRVTARLEARRDAWEKSFRSEMEPALKQAMRGRNPSDFNQAMMELGATVCTPKSPTCEVCPIASACAAYEKKAAASFPPPKPRRENIELECGVQVVLRRRSNGTDAWLVRRGEGTWFPGMWDFPSELGGASQPRAALKLRGEEFGRVRHQITHHKIQLVGRVEIVTKMLRAKADQDGRWIALDELLSGNPSVPLSTTARKMLRVLIASRHYV